MSGRDVNDDIRQDIPHLLRRIGVRLPALFHADGTPTPMVAPLELPDGVRMEQVLIAGIDYDGPAGLVQSLRIVGLRLPRVGLYVAVDDPVRSALSPLQHLIHAWPKSFEEILAFDEKHALPASTAAAMRRRVNIAISDISLCKDILRRNDVATALLVAGCKTSSAVAQAQAVRSKLASPQQQEPNGDIVAAARNLVSMSGALVELLERYRQNNAPADSVPAGPGFVGQRKELSTARVAIFKATLTVERIARRVRTAIAIEKPSERAKALSAAITITDDLAGIISRLPFEARLRPRTLWRWLDKALVSTLGGLVDSDRNTAIALVPGLLGAAAKRVGLRPDSYIDAADAISALNGERLFMLLHSARIEEALDLFPWLTAPAGIFTEIDGGLIGAVNLLLEIERCRTILAELVRRTADDAGRRLTRTAARLQLSDPAAVHAAFEKRSNLSTLLRETASSRALIQARRQGLPFDEHHPLPKMLAGEIDWALESAHRIPDMVSTTATALGTTPPLANPDGWRQDVPRFFGLTIVEFATASIQIIMTTKRRGPLQRSTDVDAAGIMLDETMLGLVRALLNLADPTGAETAIFDRRTARSRSAASGQGALKLGQRVVKSHLPARIASLIRRGGADLHTAIRHGANVEDGHAPAADQCVPAFWSRPLHDLPIWKMVTVEAKTPRLPDVVGPPSTLRDTLARELADFHAIAPALVAAMRPDDQAAIVTTWLMQGYASLASDLSFAGLR